jgi:tRNA-2-methylthio-N6-dimethylallyladenosine synthase
MANKLYIKTFGCQMNEYDTDKISEILHIKDKTVRTEKPEEADIILFNTCSVREKAQEKVFSDLGRVKKYKIRNPNVIIGVGGCVASQEGKNIIKRAPYVDLIFGPQTLHRLPKMIDEKLKTKKPQVDLEFPEVEKFDALPKPQMKGPTAFISIMEGCSKYCSFCVVPYTRGTEFSRSIESILTEVNHLVEKGVKEVTLLGQNVNSYYDENHKIDFTSLLELISEIEPLCRIRYTTSHPKEFTTRLVSSFEKLPKVTNQLHLPVQSGSDKILTAMKRGYTVIEYKSIIRQIRTHRPNISITSDFIVGFPGETESDFQNTIDLIDKVKFDGAYSFAYSDRPGTPASSLSEKISEKIKLIRLRKLQNRIQFYANEYNNNMLGKSYKVLVEGFSKKNLNQLMGRTNCNRVVNFLGESSKIGEFVELKITKAMNNSLRGELI